MFYLPTSPAAVALGAGRAAVKAVRHGNGAIPDYLYEMFADAAFEALQSLGAIQLDHIGGYIHHYLGETERP